MFVGAGLGHELGDGGVELGVAGPVAGESFHDGEYPPFSAVKAAEIFRGPLTGGKRPPISAPWPAATNTTELAVGVCRDCQRRTCEPCRVEVRRLGSLCTHCALVRAGCARR